MALVLTMRKNSSFYVADQKVTVTDILSEDHVVLKTDGAVFDVTDERSVEVLPDVFVSVGVRGQLDMARIAIEAPRHLTILREDKYGASKGNGVPRI